ncbi:hypothetical protein UFOVP1326_5 [uncultured Caudovirales phage]|uniref:Uncharacterized protein n=1 Tax=uncultured Caudovirales phage TaxID=2100421 RepID=A0A6J5SEW1_9CAUD|nr:hypothetical protein UFOVP1326_5 [uncultured Caudovirales phage]CAB4212782.1 hypothetical protein UFOVP1436_34 [uncultured Caudovirales phage]
MNILQKLRSYFPPPPTDKQPLKLNSALKQSDKALSEAISDLVTAIQEKKKAHNHEH